MSSESLPLPSDDQLDRVFAALSDPTRRTMIERLRGGALTVRELGAPFSISQPAVSKHVRVLESANLITRTIRGRAHDCRLRPEALAQIDGWLDRYRHFWNETLDSLERFADSSQSELDE